MKLRSLQAMKNNKIGLALSGGGVRASVFHLGVLARLAEEDLLEDITMTSTVSGGSLLLGLVYTSNENNWPNSTEFQNKVYPFVKKKLTERNLQLNVLYKRFTQPWVSLMNGKAKHVSNGMKKVWGITANLNDIQREPRWNICATTFQSGKSWRFVPQRRMGDYKLNYVEQPEFELADALCCSAAVPYLLGSLKLKTGDYSWFKYAPDFKTKIDFNPDIETIHLWDGGVHDNLGIEPLLNFKNGCKYRNEFNYLIVSDASAPLNPKERKRFSFKRLTDISTDQVRSIRARVLHDYFDQYKTGIYLRIGDDYKDISKKTGLNIDEVKNQMIKASDAKKCESYKTTLSKMKEVDFNLLFKHGWETANFNLKGMNPELFKNIKLKENYGV
ncbi:MAG: patatin-like phospholipase family protein [Flavobacteriales bacterium]|nr:patatin-like phospholipase family protein [Flavobacteriales bacterium]